MSFNGSGSFVINSTGQPVVATTLIESAVFNAFTADVATGLSTAILKDGTQTITANIPFGGNKITGLGAGTARTDAASLATIQDGTGIYISTVGGTADVITLTPSPAITAYGAGQAFYWIASGANTGAVTVAVSGLTAKAVTKNGSTALAAGDIPSGALVGARYDGTRFQLVSPATSGAVPLSTFTTAGDTIQATGSGAVARLGIGTARQVATVNAGATALAFQNPITLATAQPSTSGTSIDFTVPSGTRRITVTFKAVSTNGTDDIWLQLGDSGGIETSGYLGGGAFVGASSGGASSTSAFVVVRAPTAANNHNGAITLSLLDASTFTWVCEGVLGDNGNFAYVCGGSKATSAELDRIRITTSAGTNTFDAGTINISYE